MTKRKKTIVVLFAVFLVCCFSMTSLSFGQEMPKPGQVIDKSNYKQYAHLFPQEILQGFEDGLGGFYKPFVFKVVETKPYTEPKSYLALSEKNRGKYTIDKDGFIAGGYDYVGLPFPGLTKEDKDFAMKFMYNYLYRYYHDDFEGSAFDIEKRKGESVTSVEFDTTIFCFINRINESPKPTYKNPANLQWAQTFYYTYPSSWKKMQMLSYRYMDSKKSDEIYIYLPTMRRVVRGDASQRSTPIQGTTNAFDDFNGGFDGKVQAFNFKLLGEKKMLGTTESPWTIALSRKSMAEGGGLLPFSSDNWEIRDVYIIEITAKDPKYPQSKKVIYVDKDNYTIHYGAAWDRAGKLWKIWIGNWRTITYPNGDKFQTNAGQLGIDVQVGYATWFSIEGKYQRTGLKYTDFLPSIMQKRGQ